MVRGNADWRCPLTTQYLSIVTYTNRHIHVLRREFTPILCECHMAVHVANQLAANGFISSPVLAPPAKPRNAA